MPFRSSDFLECSNTIRLGRAKSESVHYPSSSCKNVSATPTQKPTVEEVARLLVRMKGTTMIVAEGLHWDDSSSNSPFPETPHTTIDMGLQSKPSRHLLPVSSFIFKSKSNASLKTTTESAAYGGAATSTTLADIGEMPDDTVTALPIPDSKTSSPMPKIGLRKKAKSDSLTSPVPDEDATDVTIVEINGKKNKESAWRRLIVAFKRSFEALKVRKHFGGRKSSAPPLIIGSPTNVVHTLSGGPNPIGTQNDLLRAFGIDAKTMLDVQGPQRVVRSETSATGWATIHD
ncbi:hypothetical protein K458DRAFT_411851 [Lentithecium fluviatile CBS 122367]|uniref:Uncharacterized protein n=1 Tax=Lentithecium fluviatile CBS 122367 TaxID=1168545 RepID=A0A6G1JNT9_9PLEO|nr:hypothetical protein K458DRAFT_411851 [Lentithecium fluviatile CBS 122367]